MVFTYLGRLDKFETFKLRTHSDKSRHKLSWHFSKPSKILSMPVSHILNHMFPTSSLQPILLLFSVLPSNLVKNSSRWKHRKYFQYGNSRYSTIFPQLQLFHSVLHSPIPSLKIYLFWMPLAHKGKKKAEKAGNIQSIEETDMLIVNKHIKRRLSRQYGYCS